MLVTLRFLNRTAAHDGHDAEIIDLEVNRGSIKPIMAWYGAYYAGDDYDVFINGREVGMDQNGEFEAPTIDGCSTGLSAQTFAGMNFAVDPNLPPNTVEIRHPDGRVNRFEIEP